VRKNFRETPQDVEALTDRLEQGADDDTVANQSSIIRDIKIIETYYVKSHGASWERVRFSVVIHANPTLLWSRDCDAVGIGTRTSRAARQVPTTTAHIHIISRPCYHPTVSH
jgi:hypothetical protein